MKVAFYAPMKSPKSPVPSGDRLIGRLLIRALEITDIEVTLISHFRSYDRHGNNDRQLRLKSIGEKLADRIIRRINNAPSVEKPDIWLTYHLFHKAPDWIGPRVARCLSIPYVVAEASFAPKQANGVWALGHEAIRNTLTKTDLVIGLNSKDADCVIPNLQAPNRYKYLHPFLDTTLFDVASNNSVRHRQSIANKLNIDDGVPWLLTVAMMRSGDKVESYQILADALALITDESWILLVVGSGPAEAHVRSLFSELSARVVWLGKMESDQLSAFYAASDLFVWPAVKESPGMCFLEAQAAGTPVIGSNSGGVADVVIDGKTGLLARHRDAADFAEQTKKLLLDKPRRHAMAIASRHNVSSRHRIENSGQRLKKLLSELIE